MADTIIGIAVLDLGDEPPSDLHIACECGNSDKLVKMASMRVQPKGSAHSQYIWDYEILHAAAPGVVGRLRVSPSFHWIEVFHNDGLWEVLYLEYDDAEYGSPALMLQRVNPGREIWRCWGNGKPIEVVGKNLSEWESD